MTHGLNYKKIPGLQVSRATAALKLLDFYHEVGLGCVRVFVSVIRAMGDWKVPKQGNPSFLD